MKTIFKNYLNEYSTICVLGLAKNTGKTTTINRFIKEAQNLHKKTGIISTGRDGERRDVFTNMDKPKITATPGMIFSSTEGSIKKCKAKSKILEKTDYKTSMGNVVIAEAQTTAPIEVAGPVSVEETIELEHLLHNKYQAETVLIDGSINRIAIATSRLNAGLIIATGAVLGTLEQILSETMLKVRLLQLPSANEETCSIISKNHNETLFIQKNNTFESSTTPLLQELDLIPQNITSNTKSIYTNGAISDTLLGALYDHAHPVELVTEDASKIFISDRSLNQWLSMKGTLAVRNQLHLLGITCNPCNPQGTTYEPKLFKTTLENNLTIPVYDVMID